MDTTLEASCSSLAIDLRVEVSDLADTHAACNCAAMASRVYAMLDASIKYG